MISGYTAALGTPAQIIVKIDGDGQMNPAYLTRLLEPLRTCQADYAKGNRFYDFAALRAMPTLRRLGNTALTFLVKAASGYWSVSDPSNGYTAIRRETLELINFEWIDRGYFFESSMLIQLNVLRAVAVDVPIPAKYCGEPSSMNLMRVFLSFPWRLALGFLRRLYYRYFFYDISATSVFLLCGLALMGFGAGFGAYRWYEGVVEGRVQTAGTVILAAVPLILGFQFLLQAIVLDVQDRPTTPISNMWLSDSTRRPGGEAEDRAKSDGDSHRWE
jgi:glycosyltransferase involved in cell wall biosynthesis